MSKTKLFLPMFALLLCMGAILFPVTAFAQSNEDTTPPTVTAQISGEMLNIMAEDDTGVEAIYINGHKFSTLANGTASIYLKDYAGTGAKIEVYATDTEGNRSQSVILDNPFYTAPQTTPTPAAPSTPSTTTPTVPPATSTPASTTPPATSTPASSDLDDDGTDATGDDEPGTESAIGTGDSVSTPGGTGTVTEVATDEDGKLFYTIQTPAGNVFYLVIDMARTDGNNVYFLNAVTEDDLLALAEMDGATTGGVSAIPTPEPEPQPAPEPDPQPEPTPEPEPENESGRNGALIFIILAVIAIGGTGYYLKIVKPRKQATMQGDDYDDEADDEFEDDSEYSFEDGDGAYFYGDAEGGGEEPFDNA